MFHLPETPKKTIDIQTPQTQSVKFSVVNLAHIAERHLQKKDISPNVVNCYHQREVNYVKDVSCVNQLSFVKPVNQCSSCCLKSTCRGKTTKLLEKLGNSGCRSESHKNPQTRPHPPVSDPADLTRSPTIISQSPQEPLPGGGITSAYRQNAVELVQNRNSRDFSTEFPWCQNPTTGGDLY